MQHRFSTFSTKIPAPLSNHLAKHNAEIGKRKCNTTQNNILHESCCFYDSKGVRGFWEKTRVAFSWVSSVSKFWRKTRSEG